jgi:DNA-binding transcriptional ArsR family regulator
MDINTATAVFGALAQESRLRVLRLLVKHGPNGAPAGSLSNALRIPHNTLSFHLAQLSHAGLVVSRRQGRSIIYSADFEMITELIRFLVEDCCREDVAHVRTDRKRGRSVIELFNCCPPKEEKR